MDAAKSVTATFAAEQHALSVTLSGAGSGAVTSQPAGVDCPAGACQAGFDYGATVTLTAAADVDSVFGGWAGPAPTPAATAR